MRATNYLAQQLPVVPNATSTTYASLMEVMSGTSCGRVHLKTLVRTFLQCFVKTGHFRFRKPFAFAKVQVGWLLQQ